MQDTEALDLIDATANARKFQVILKRLFDEMSVIDEKSNIVFRFLAIARQHYDTIVLLIEQERNPSSACALLRPLSEVMNRGVWVSACAQPDQIRKIVTKTFDFAKVNFAKEVADSFGGNGLSQKQRDVLHGFTHGGYEQLERQVSNRGLIEPEFDLPFLTKAVRSSSVAISLLASHAAVTVDRLDIANAVWNTWVRLFEQRIE